MSTPELNALSIELPPTFDLSRPEDQAIFGKEIMECILMTLETADGFEVARQAVMNRIHDGFEAMAVPEAQRGTMVACGDNLKALTNVRKWQEFCNRPDNTNVLLLNMSSIVAVQLPTRDLVYELAGIFTCILIELNIMADVKEPNGDPNWLPPFVPLRLAITFAPATGRAHLVCSSGRPSTFMQTPWPEGAPKTL
jgi:hypothetical protein